MIATDLLEPRLQQWDEVLKVVRREDPRLVPLDESQQPTVTAAMSLAGLSSCALTPSDRTASDLTFSDLTFSAAL